MPRQRLYFAEARTAAALLCSAIAVLIAVGEEHFTVHARSPSSFLIMEHHKCGRLVLLCIGWLVLETAHLIYRWFFPIEAPYRVRHVRIVD